MEVVDKAVQVDERAEMLKFADKYVISQEAKAHYAKPWETLTIIVV